MARVAELPSKDSAAHGRAAGPQAVERFRTAYYAFLSYSHTDEASAEWLHRELECFRVPPTLAGKITGNGSIPRRLTPIFRDRHELAAATDLGAEIKAALASSQYLIVLCSPAAAKSRWTNAEIDAFKRSRPDGCVLAAIVAGEPFASGIAGREDEECFPPALREKYDRRGRPTGKPAEPLAADLRDSGDGRRIGFLKLVAGMLGLGLDDLVQRETTQRQRRMAWLAAASLGGMAVTSTLAVVAFQSRDEARDQRREAEGLVGFMLGDLKDKLEPIGRLAALDAVGSRALAYFEKQDKSALSDAALAQRAKALTMMGEIAQTRGDTAGALKRYQEALASTGEALRRYPDDGQRVFDHAQNVFYVGYIAYQRGDLNNAAAHFREYKALANRMVVLAPDKKEYRAEQLSANNNLGTVRIDQNRFKDAASTYQASLNVAETMAAAEPRDVALQKRLINTLAWLADAHEYSGALDQALAERERQLRLISDLERADPRDTETQRTAMTAHRSIGRLLASRGDAAGGLKELLASVAISDELFRIEPENTEWLQANVSGRFDLAGLQLAVGQTAAAGTTIRSGCDIVERLMRRDAKVANWSIEKRTMCLLLRARLAIAEQNPAEALQLADLATAAVRATPASNERGTWMFESLLVSGNAHALLNHREEAVKSWQAAVAALPKAIELRPREQALLAITQMRLGNAREAQRLMSSLAAIGYRHPAYMSAIKAGSSRA
ncbi:MAG: toll/interleukin-1 receptor domain-containing protein [Sphingomicrobium sp.]